MSVSHLLIFLTVFVFGFSNLTYAGALIDNSVNSMSSDLQPLAMASTFAMAEYAIGRSRLKANSTLEILVRVGVWLIRKFIIKK